MISSNIHSNPCYLLVDSQQQQPPALAQEAVKEKRLRASGSWDIQVEGAAGGGHSADMMRIFDFMGIPCKVVPHS